MSVALRTTREFPSSLIRKALDHAEMHLSRRGADTFRALTKELEPLRKKEEGERNAPVNTEAHLGLDFRKVKEYSRGDGAGTKPKQRTKDKISKILLRTKVESLSIGTPPIPAEHPSHAAQPYTP